eukprot:m.873201 g.873201  ORF g.873201 m.873201 type:complete len:322 (-) comp59784_c1_seq13:662-1627(-)
MPLWSTTNPKQSCLFCADPLTFPTRSRISRQNLCLSLVAKHIEACFFLPRQSKVFSQGYWSFRQLIRGRFSPLFFLFSAAVLSGSLFRRYFMCFFVVMFALSVANRRFGLKIVGHSLGAGTAALLTLLLKNQHPNLSIECFAFACPPVVTRSIAVSPAARDAIRTFVLQNDIVPRLSVHNFIQFRKTAEALIDHDSDLSTVHFFPRLWRFLHSLKAKFYRLFGVSVDETAGRASESPKITALRQSIPAPNHDEMLLVPALCYKLSYHVHIETSMMTGSFPEDLDHIVLAKNMVLEHFPFKYEAALSAASGRRKAVSTMEWQ